MNMRTLVWIGIFALSCGPAFLRGESVPDTPENRERRTAEAIAEALAQKYGHAMPQVAYIPALALWGRLWLAEIQNKQPARDEVVKLAIAAPEPKEWSGPAVAGHLIFAAIGDRNRVLKAAALGLDEKGDPRDHLENWGGMSDSVFMDCPLLTAAGRLTEEDRYFTAAANHLFFLEENLMRKSGIYDHSKKCQAAWGRGNGFPALGVALMLTEFPSDHPDRKDLEDSFREHLEALSKHQDANGMWHQIIDRPESYPEFTCTCMIAFAMQRGVRLKLLDQKIYQPMVDRAWTAIKRRIHLDGEAVEGVCPSTGALATLEDYLKRPEVNGRDERGGAMALMFALEKLSAEKGLGGEE